MKSQVGNIIKVSHIRFKGVHTYEILSDNVKNDSFGRFKLQMISEDLPNTDIKTYKPGERISVVEDLWFNERLTGRQIQVLNK